MLDQMPPPTWHLAEESPQWVLQFLSATTFQLQTSTAYHCGYVSKEIMNTYRTQVLTFHWIKAFLSSIASFCHHLPCGSHEISVGFACSNNLDAEFETKKITLL